LVDAGFWCFSFKGWVVYVWWFCVGFDVVILWVSVFRLRLVLVGLYFVMLWLVAGVLFWWVFVNSVAFSFVLLCILFILFCFVVLV